MNIRLLLPALLLLLCSPLLQAASTAVTLAEVRQDQFAQQLYASGTLRAWQSTDLRPQVSGRITRLALEEGAWVEKGALLLQLDDREARSRFLQNEINLREAERQLNRFQRLRSTQAISQDQLEAQAAQVDILRAQLLFAQAELERYRITAPFSGYLGQHQLTEGMLLDSGSLITTLDDLRHMQVDFTLSERHLNHLRTGLALKAASLAWPDHSFPGEISGLGTRIDPVTRNISLRGKLDNSGGLLRPGMLVSLTLETARRQALIVPARSLTFSGREKAVFVVSTDGVAKRRVVEVGATRAEWAEILSGLEVGEQVIDQGVVRVRDGMQVQPLLPDEQA